MDDLTSSTLSDLAQGIRHRKISPVELTRAYLDRIARIDHTLHAFITVDGDRALAAAVTLEREAAAGTWRGPLHGVPLAHKDLFLIPGLPTSCGTLTPDYFVGAPPATAVARLQAAGALTLGKLNMTELALGPFGITLPRGARRRRGAEVGEVRQRRIPQRAGRSHVGRRRVEPRHLPVPAGERQIEQRLADRLGKLAGILLRRRDVGDQGPQIDAQPSVERTLHSRAIDRRQHDAGDDQDHHGPSRCREEQSKGE